MSFREKILVKLAAAEPSVAQGIQKGIHPGVCPLILAAHAGAYTLRVSAISAYATPKTAYKHSQSCSLRGVVTVFLIVLVYFVLQTFFDFGRNRRGFCFFRLVNMYVDIM